MTTKSKRKDALRILEEHSGRLSFGEMLRSIREGEDATQVDFAATLGISKQHLCDLERGRKSVSVERAIRFARILRYSKTQFVRLALQAQVDEARAKLIVDVRVA